MTTERGWRGGERQLELLVRGLSGAFQCTIAVRPGSEAVRRLAGVQASIVTVPMRGEWDILSAARLRRLARAEGVSLLHAHTGHAHALTLPAAHALGLPLLVTRRVESHARLVNFGWRKYLDPVVRYVAVSKAIARGLIEGGIRADRIEVIPDGVDLSGFGTSDPGPVRAELGCAEGDILFGNVAAMSPEKDQATLLQAFARAEHHSPKVRLAIVGSGPLQRKLHDLAGSLGLRRVVFTGWQENVPGLLGAFDVFVLTSRREGLGLSIAEALASGRPVVATRAGGIPELIQPGLNGVLVDPGDVDALAGAMLEIADDPAKRCRMGEAARVWARERFGAKRMVEAHISLYRHLLE